MGVSRTRSHSLIPIDVNWEYLLMLKRLTLRDIPSSDLGATKTLMVIPQNHIDGVWGCLQILRRPCERIATR